METKSNIKQLIKILVGAAWIDGKIQPEEREYLYRVANEKGVAEDTEIHPLLSELRPVQQEECYKWIQAYLGDRPEMEDYQRLIDSISALIYSDGDVANEEAKLLSQLQLLEPDNQSPKSTYNSLLKTIQKIYQGWLDQQT